VVVSNHGGRQLDGVAASLDALPEVVEAARRQKQGGREVKTEMASVQSFVAFTFTLSLSRISTPAFSQLLRLRDTQTAAYPRCRSRNGK